MIYNCIQPSNILVYINVCCRDINARARSCIFSKYTYGISHAIKMEAHVKRLLHFVLVAAVLQCVQVQIASAVACAFVSGSKCKCTLADGSGEIDLSPLFAKGKLSVQGTGKEYVATLMNVNPSQVLWKASRKPHKACSRSRRGGEREPVERLLCMGTVLSSLCSSSYTAVMFECVQVPLLYTI